MKLYTNNRGDWAGTQADAKAKTVQDHRENNQQGKKTMKIIIQTKTGYTPTDDSKHAQAAHAALDAVNGTAASYTLFAVSQLREVAELAAAKLDSLPKSQHVGAVIEYTPRGPKAKAYRYPAVSTRVTLERFSTGWCLTNVERAEVWPGNPARVDIEINQAQAAEIAERSVAEFTVV